MASYMMGDEMMGGAWNPKTRTTMKGSTFIQPPVSRKASPISSLQAKMMQLKKTSPVPVVKPVSSWQANMMRLKKISPAPAIKPPSSWLSNVKSQIPFQAAAKQQEVIAQAQEPTLSTPEISPIPDSEPSPEQKKSSFLIPALIGIGVIAASMGGL